MKRNYKLGDMVIIKKRDPDRRGIEGFRCEFGMIKRIDRYRFIVQFSYREESYMLDTLRNSKNKKSDIDKVVCVRRPRKGNSESRAIVANLAKEYRRFLNNCLRANLKFKASCKAIRVVNKESSSIRWVLYQQAKEMLK